MKSVASFSASVPLLQFNVSSCCILIPNKISYACFYKELMLTASVEI